MPKKNKGGAKAPPKGDTTQKRRQSKRTTRLNEKAQVKGWSGISEYLTAILNDEATIPQRG